VKVSIVTIVLAAFCAVPALAQEGVLRLSLKEAIRQAVEKNLDVKAELYNPAIAEGDVRKNLGIYDTLLTLSTGFDYSITQPASAFLSGAEINRLKRFNLTPGASQLLSTGGTVGLSFDNLYTNTNADPARFMSHYWQSDATVTLSQPLLKNRGKENTELNITVAKYNKDGSLERFRTRLLDTVARVRIEYNRLHTLRAELEVRKSSLQLARKILGDTQGRIKAGVLPAMESLNAEFGVAGREKDLIDAERAVMNQNDALRVLLQIPVQEEIIPVDVPSKEPFQVKADEMVRRALAERPEIREQQANLRSSELQSRVARNQTLPDLNLNASASLNGLDMNYNRNLEKVGSGDYPAWGVALQFSYPLGNNAAESEYVRSRLRVDQTKTQVRSLEANVANEVKTAIRGVEATYKQIEVTDRGSAFAEERLRSFIKRNEVGLATTRDVLDVENDLAAARNGQIQALAGYNDAITQLLRATGELLEREGINVTEQEGNSLYEQYRKK